MSDRRVRRPEPLRKVRLRDCFVRLSTKITVLKVGTCFRGEAAMLLAVIAVVVEVYQVVAHAHCLTGRTLPQSHRGTLGFGVAIAGDALAYLLSCYCLHAAGVRF